MAPPPLGTPQTAGGVGKSALTLRFIKGCFVETVSARSFLALPSLCGRRAIGFPKSPHADSAARLVLHIR